MPTNSHYKIGFIGGGNMSSALIIGLKNQQFNPEQIQVVELDQARRNALQQNLQVHVTADLKDIAQNDVIVLAVKPQQLKAVALELAPLLSQQLVISIAAGVRLTDLSRWLNQYSKIIRCMPNTPAQIQMGITGLYAMPLVSALEKETATQILSAAGQTLWLANEDEIDAVTAISGSGPAYVFYLIEALQEAAINLGLTVDQAKQLSIATFKGASLLAESSSTPIHTLREQVTSKGGTTEQGLLSLAQSQVKQAMILATQQAEKRAKILGDELGKL
ncbi:MAG: pyrroline-5-carboxylate reductase [Methylophilus sp.]|jgi:pyrroline-5-carboxylate reductase